MQSSWLPCASGLGLINVNKGKWGERGGKDEVSFFISILKSQFTSRASSLLIRYIKNGLRRDPGGLDGVEADRMGPWETLQTSSWKKITFWASWVLSRGTVQPFSSIRFHPWLAWYLRDIWSLTGVTDLQIHADTCNSILSQKLKGDMPRGTGKSTCSHTGLYKHMHTLRGRCKCTSKYQQTQACGKTGTNPNTQTYVNMQGYKHAGPGTKI